MYYWTLYIFVSSKPISIIITIGVFQFMRLHNYWRKFSFIRCLEPLVVSLGYSLFFHHFLHICFSSLACQPYLVTKRRQKVPFKIPPQLLTQFQIQHCMPTHLGINTQSFENTTNWGLTVRWGRTTKKSGLKIFKQSQKNCVI